jgi:hypothetical protein
MQHEAAARMDFANYFGHRLNILHQEANLHMVTKQKTL